MESLATIFSCSGNLIHFVHWFQLLTYVHTLYWRHWSRELHRLSSKRTDWTLDNKYHSWLHTCYPCTGRSASLLTGWADNDCHLRVLCSRTDHSVQFRVQCNDAVKLETLFSHAGQLLVITMIIRMRSGLRAKLSLKSKRAGWVKYFLSFLTIAFGWQIEH